MKIHVAVGPIAVTVDDPSRRASVEFVDGVLGAIGARFPQLDHDADGPGEDAEVVELASRIGFVPNPILPEPEDEDGEDEDDGEPLDLAA